MKPFWSKLLIVLVAVTAAIVLIFGGLTWYMALRPNVESADDYTLLVRPTEDVEDVTARLEDDNVLRSPDSFELLTLLADRISDCKIRPGRYVIKHGMRNIDILRMLRHGWQSPVRLVINNMRLPEDFAASVGSQMMYDSASIMSFITDSASMQKIGLTYQNLFAHIVENTYEVWWNATPEELLTRLTDEDEKFWAQNNRKDRAAKLGLTPADVCTVASIVDCESHCKSELSTIAGLYINRLNKGMLLQSDPTVKFALRDFAKKRILNQDLRCPSPYNTYLYKGLPPGPICLPNQTTIEAVLNAEKTNYLYMCADPSLNGMHRFAVTETEHLANARAYHQAISKLHIMK